MTTINAESGTEASMFLNSLLNQSKKGSLLKPKLDVVRDKQFTLSSGKRLVLKPKTESTKEKEKDIVENLPWNLKNKNGDFECLDMNKLYAQLRIEEINDLQLKKYQKEQESLKTSLNKLDLIAKDTDGLPKKKNKKNVQVNSLWTEKYRPKKFIDLIGNEKVNASILKWLNEWNYSVRNGKLIDSRDKDIHFDPLNRPRRKILLIHGPPGIGKTSITQCVCKQLGYEIHEINSSDERSGSVVKEKVKNSLKMRSLSGKNVCLVLDEIDGAVGNEHGFIKVLIHLLNKDIKVTEEWKNYNKLKYNKNDDFLKRPIIAMCNDINAHCLDQLKPYCEIVQFKKTTNKSIKKRLKSILEIEKVSEVNESLLDDLIISLDGDIRNCINFLQFNSRSLNGKIKDTEINWFQILKDIFNLENKNVKNKKSKTDIFRELSAKLNNSTNELNKINNGCFNLMLQATSDDDRTTLKKLNEVSDWLYFQDRLNRSFSSFEKDEIKLYGSITPLKFFSLFANFSDNYHNSNDRFNFKSQENFDRKRLVTDLLNSLLREYSFKINRNELVVNEIFMLNNIVVPHNLNIKQFELQQTKIERIAAILKELHIGIESYPVNNKIKFRTSYDNFIKFKPNLVSGLMDAKHKVPVLDSATKEPYKPYKDSETEESDLNEIKSMPFLKVLHQQLKKEHLMSKAAKRIRDEINDGDDENSSGFTLSAGSTKRQQTEDRKPVSTVDFFKQYADFKNQLHAAKSGNSATTGNNGSSEPSGSVMRQNENRIWVKYHEGFSNAVRKEMTWNELFN